MIWAISHTNTIVHIHTTFPRTIGFPRDKTSLGRATANLFRGIIMVMAITLTRLANALIHRINHSYLIQVDRDECPGHPFPHCAPSYVCLDITHLLCVLFVGMYLNLLPSRGEIDPRVGAKISQSAYEHWGLTNVIWYKIFIEVWMANDTMVITEIVWNT
jgi:hypothetical protein